MNTICLMGRLTADPELRHTSTQVAVTTFTLAVDRAYQPKNAEQRQTDFINIVAWRQTAEFVVRYFHKGNRLAVEGSLQTRRYTDKDGNPRTAYEVVANNVFFCESKSQSGYQASPAPQSDSQVPQFNEAPTAFSTAAPGDFEEIVDDDDLPF